jgi:hypothetical protein
VFGLLGGVEGVLWFFSGRGSAILELFFEECWFNGVSSGLVVSKVQKLINNNAAAQSLIQWNRLLAHI